MAALKYCTKQLDAQKRHIEYQNQASIVAKVLIYQGSTSELATSPKFELNPINLPAVDESPLNSQNI